MSVRACSCVLFVRISLVWAVCVYHNIVFYVSSQLVLCFGPLLLMFKVWDPNDWRIFWQSRLGHRTSLKVFRPWADAEKAAVATDYSALAECLQHIVAIPN